MDRTRILLVDDEKALLSLLKRFLERAGFEVAAFPSAEEVLESMAAWPADRPPHVLVADEQLPGESGTALAIALLPKFPELRCLLCSGYPLSLDALPESIRGRAAILQKPYMPPALEQAIRGLVEGAL